MMSKVNVLRRTNVLRIDADGFYGFLIREYSLSDPHFKNIFLFQLSDWMEALQSNTGCVYWRMIDLRRSKKNCGNIRDCHVIDY